MARGRASGGGSVDPNAKTYSWITHDLPGNEKYPYYYSRSDDPGYGYIPDYLDPTNTPKRYKIEDILWLVGQRATGAVTRRVAAGKARETNVTALEGRIAVTYGRDRIAPPIFDLVQGAFTVDGQNLSGHIAGFSFGHGVVDAIEQLTLYGDKIQKCSGDPNLETGFSGPLGNLATWHFRNGEVDQLVDPDLAAAHALLGHAYPFQYPGVAYAVLRLIYEGDGARNSQGRTSSWPTALWQIRGKRLLDPRLGMSSGLPDSAPEWSENPALALADYLASPYYGAGAGINGIDWDSVADIADYCDFGIGTDKVLEISVVEGGKSSYFTPPTITLTAPPGGGTQATAEVTGWRWAPLKSAYEMTGIRITNPGSGYLVAPTLSYSTPFFEAPNVTAYLGEKRHTINTTFMRGASRRDIASTIALAFRGGFIRRRGKYVLIADRSRASEFEFTPSNMRPVSVARRSYSSLPNRVIGTWVNPRKDYREEKAIAETAGVTAGTEAVRQTEFALELCRYPGEAKRAVFYELNKGLLNLGVSIVGEIAECEKLEPGDRCGLTTLVAGLENQDVAITSRGRSQDNHYEFQLEMYDETLYDFEPHVIDPQIATTYDDPSVPPPPPSSIGSNQWGPAYLLSTERFLATWSGTGMTSIDITKMNDGIETVTAAVCPATATSRIQLDLGVGVTKSFKWLYLTVEGTIDLIEGGTTLVPKGLSVEYKLNAGDAWTASDPGTRAPMLVRTSGTKNTYRIGVAPGFAARYYSVFRDNATVGATLTIYEAWFREETAIEAPTPRSWRIYDATGVLLEERSAREDGAGDYVFPPGVTVTTLTHDIYGGVATIDIVNDHYISAVSQAGVEGERARYYNSPAVLPGSGTSSVPYFTNKRQDIDVPTAALLLGDNVDFDSTIVRMESAAADFNVQGLGTAGLVPQQSRMAILHNDTTYVMTLKNESGTASAASQRFVFPDASDYVVQAGASALLIYDTGDQRWKLAARQDAPITNPFFKGSVWLSNATGASTMGVQSLDGSNTELKLQSGALSYLSLRRKSTDQSLAIIFRSGGPEFELVNISNAGLLSVPSISLNGTTITASAAEINFLVGVTSAIQTQLNAKAPLASPTFTGTPAAPTAAPGTSTTQIATTAFVATSFLTSATAASTYAPIVSPVHTGGITLTNPAGSSQVLVYTPDAASPAGIVLGHSGTQYAAITRHTDQRIAYTFRNGVGAALEMFTMSAAGLFSTVSLALNGTTITATGTQINFLVGVTSAIQTQLDLKAPLASPAFTGTVTLATLTSSGNVAFGEAVVANQRLAVKGATADSTTNCALFRNSSSTVILQVRNDGAVGIGMTPNAAYSLALVGAILERNRSVGMGEWIAFTPTRLAASGTWTGGTVTGSYMLVGKTLFVRLHATGTSVSATPAYLYFTVPGGFTLAAVETVGPATLKDAGTVKTGSYRGPASDTSILIYTAAALTGGWATASGTTDVFLNVQFQIA